ncbi:MAG TPA: TVP38/TMEM64 family protein [Deltaproteobacteria bacterium]|nr:TVP38/TMEM64 family protein [Deltaproteobacteria bacterium]
MCKGHQSHFMKNSLTLRITLLILLVGAASWLFIYFDLHLIFKNRPQLILFIKAFHPYDAVAFVLLQITQVVAAPIPGELTGFIGGYLYGPLWGTIYSTIGLTLGSWMAFMLARFFGMPLLGRLVKKDVFEKFEHFMEHKGMVVSFLLFLIPGFPKDYLCYILGVSRIPTWAFLVISVAGRLIGTIMLSVTGNVARNEQYFLLAVIVGIGAVIFIFAYYYRDKILESLKKKKG